MKPVSIAEHEAAKRQLKEAMRIADDATKLMVQRDERAKKAIEDADHWRNRYQDERELFESQARAAHERNVKLQEQVSKLERFIAGSIDHLDATTAGHEYLELNTHLLGGKAHAKAF